MFEKIRKFNVAKICNIANLNNNDIVTKAYVDSTGIFYIDKFLFEQQNKEFKFFVEPFNLLKDLK